jgi:hypothetical protein
VTVEEVPSNEDEVVGTLHDITERKRAEIAGAQHLQSGGHAEQR